MQLLFLLYLKLKCDVFLEESCLACIMYTMLAFFLLVVSACQKIFEARRSNILSKFYYCHSSHYLLLSNVL